MEGRGVQGMSCDTCRMPRLRRCRRLGGKARVVRPGMCHHVQPKMWLKHHKNKKKKKRKARFFQLPRDACKFGEFIVIVVINIPCRLMWRTFSRKIDCSFRLLAARVFKLLLPMPV
jgi:hypothetical protein